MPKKHSTAAKRGEMRNAPEEDPEFQIAPMIDILLVLLVFFMSISSTEVLQSNDQVKLPVAKDAKDKDKKNNGASGQSILNVLWSPINNSGSIECDSNKFDAPAEMVPYLQQKINTNPSMRVLVRADKSVRYEYMKSMLRAVAQAGVSNVTFSVVDKEPGAPAAAAAPTP
jgi:biopolymer transport protein ExbD